MTGEVVHGGARPAELRALGLRPEDVIDFSASVNPLGPPPAVREALARLDPSAYPDPDCTELREALAAREGVSPAEVFVGNGSVEILHLLAAVSLEPGDAAVVFAPAFGEYEAACRRRGARVTEVRAREEDGFRWNLDAALSALPGARLVFLGNPNNPTGVYLARDEVERILAAAFPGGTAGGLLVLDEAYRSFVEAPWPSTGLARGGRAVLVRSLTKDCGLAGLRLGYCLAAPEVVARLRAAQVTWSVNAAAQAAGLAALADAAHLERSRAAVREAKAYLVGALRDLGLPVTAGAANFLLVRTGRAAEVRRRLLRHGLLVRDCTSFGLRDHVRIGVRTRPECERLVAALAAVLEG